MGSASVPEMPADTWAALERLMQIAQGETGQCRYVANFLLAWWNAGELGGFNFTDAWAVDGTIQADMILLFAFVARHSVYPSAYSFGGEFKELPDNGTVHIKGGEIFVSHVRQGQSS